METKVIDDRDEFLLCLCPYMVGMKEAWVINKVIYVSPALFQLLTDDDDLETILKIASQLSLKAVTHDDLQALARSKREMSHFVFHLVVLYGFAICIEPILALIFDLYPSFQ